MMSLHEIMQQRRDTRHFTTDEVPQEVLDKAILAGHFAPSVGLTNATRFYIVRKAEIKSEIKKIFQNYHEKAANLTDSPTQKEKYLQLKLEAIEEAPIGLIIAYDRSVLDNFTIGTVGSNEAIKYSAVCAAQNVWLSLTEQGFSMGWVSILNHYDFKNLLNFPEYIEPIGYFCVGKPATNYDNQPMLQQLKWNEKTVSPVVTEIENTVIKQEVNFENVITEINSSKISSEAIQQKIDNKTKPLGALGKLETIAYQIATIQQSLEIKITNPTLVVFAADHGIANHGVSAYPQEVTRQMVENFLSDGAAINVFCKQNNIDLKIVDAGVNYDFPKLEKLIDKKVAKGTQSFLQTPAMSLEELHLAFQFGKEITEQVANSGSNCIGFGEMGIGNTSSASVLMSVLTQIPIADCVGKGTGVDSEKYNKKVQLLSDAISNHNITNLEENLACFGGFEIIQMAGAMLEAYNKNMLVLVDGFIATVSYLIASIKNPEIKKNAIFCHCSSEKAHLTLLNYLNAEPLINLEMRLGEGSGVAVAFPIVQSAVAFFNEMASFESAGVSNKE